MTQPLSAIHDALLRAFSSVNANPPLVLQLNLSAEGGVVHTWIEIGDALRIESGINAEADVVASLDAQELLDCLERRITFVDLHFGGRLQILGEVALLLPIVEKAGLLGAL